MILGSSNGLMWQCARLLGVAAELGETCTVVAAHALNITTTMAASAQTSLFQPLPMG